MNLVELERESDPTLVQLRAWLAQKDLAESMRLPPERILAGELGVTRGDLRKALSVLEKEGVIWRHVGKGTFIGAKPLDEMMSLSTIERRTNPAEVMRTRLMLEPELARHAALHATREDVAEMVACMTRARKADSWRQYEAQDNALHRAIARAAANNLALALFDALNAVRRAVVWGRIRRVPDRPPRDHHSFAEHASIVAAIEQRNPHEAAAAMRRHLRHVEAVLIEAHLGREDEPLPPRPAEA